MGIPTEVLGAYLVAMLIGGAMALFCHKVWLAFLVAALVTILLCTVLGPAAAHYAEQWSIQNDPSYKTGPMSPVPGAILISLIAGPVAGVFVGWIVASVVRTRRKENKTAAQADADLER